MASKNKRPMTNAGYGRLAGEYRKLVDVERPKVVQGVADAAAEGDRSENAEYIYGKKRLREIDKRLAYLGRILDEVEIIDPQSLRGSVVCFASTVVVMDDRGQERRWTIVGEGEVEADGATMSWRSPLARQLLGRKVGDVVEVEGPEQIRSYEIIDLYFGKRRWNQDQSLR